MIAESLLLEYKSREVNYTKQIDNLNNKIKLDVEKCRLLSLNTDKENLQLKGDNKTLRKNKNFWKSIAIGEPIVLVAGALYFILK